MALPMKAATKTPERERDTQEIDQLLTPNLMELPAPSLMELTKHELLREEHELLRAEENSKGPMELPAPSLMELPAPQTPAREAPIDVAEATRRLIRAINAMNRLVEIVRGGQHGQDGTQAPTPVKGGQHGQDGTQAPTPPPALTPRGSTTSTGAYSSGQQSGQGEGELWTYTPANGLPIDHREVPDIHGNRTAKTLRPGDTFRVIEERKVGSVTFLRLAGGEGWLFDNKPNVGIMCTKVKAQEALQNSEPTLEPKAADRICMLTACCIFLLLVGVICFDAGSFVKAIIPIAWLVVMLVVSVGVFFLIKKKCRPTEEVSMLQAPLVPNQP